jgi:predicted nucleic-acid-binding Zn-ribbon protein
MPFTPEQFHKIVEALQGRFKEECPSCAHKNFTVQDGLVMLGVQQQLGIVIGGPTLPCIPVVCTNCGFTLLFNAIVLGLGETLGVTPPQEKKEVSTNG